MNFHMLGGFCVRESLFLELGMAANFGGDVNL